MKRKGIHMMLGALLIGTVLVLSASGAAIAGSGSGHSHAAGAAAADVASQADITAVPNCPICGMDRAKFAHSRVYVTYDDDSVFGACSIHCAAIDMAHKLGQAPAAIQVGDFDTRLLIDAESAVWVLGGDQMGVMTKRAKWAFGTPEAAQAFVSKHGGEQVDFETAIKAAYEDMYEDTRMIREKRKKMKKMKQ